MSRRELLVLLGVVAAAAGVATLIGEVIRQTGPEMAVPRIPADAVDDPSRTLEITWLGPPNFANAEPGNWLQRRLEERFNIRLKPVYLDQNQYERKKPLMLASGRVPDVLWINDPDTLQRDAFHGFLCEVPYELLERYAPTQVKLLRQAAPHAWLYAHWQGRNFGLPSIYWKGLYARPGVWRMDWLRAVGIEKVPETLEEMREALYRFRHNDPDGNGLKDTYGMSGDVTDWWWSTFSDVFAAYGVLPFDWQFDDAGQVIWGGTSDGAYRAIRTLHDWYADELIDPAFQSDTMNYDQLKKKFQNGRIGYINYMAEFSILDDRNATSLAGIMKKRYPRSELAAAWFPKGPDGHRGGRTWSTGGNILCFGKHVADDPAKAVRVLTMLETLLREAIDDVKPSGPDDVVRGWEAKYGRRGIHWDWKDPAQGPSGGRRFLPPYDGKFGSLREGLHNDLAFYFLLDPPPEVTDRFLGERPLEFRNTYQKPKWVLTDAFGKPNVMASAGDYLKDLQKFQLKQYTRFIVDGVDEAAWDAFADEWRRRGGAVLLEEARQIQDDMRRIYRRLDIPMPGSAGEGD